MYEVHISILFLKRVFLKDPLTFILIEEEEHVRWLLEWLLVRFGECAGKEESVSWVSHGFVCPFLEFGAEVPEVEWGLPVSGTGMRSGVTGVM